MIWLFVFAVIGLTRIMIDAEIMEPIDNWANCYLPKKVYHGLFECYQCCGFWMGTLLGWICLTNNPLIIFAAGCAGSFLADFTQSTIKTMERYQDAS